MGNICGKPRVNEPNTGSQYKQLAPSAAGQEIQPYSSEAPAVSAGTQQSRTPHPDPHAQGAGAQPGTQHPSVSGSTTTTTTTTRETRENERGDGLMPLGQPAIHEDYTPRHNHMGGYVDNEDSRPQTVPTSWTKGKLIGAGAFGRVFQGLDDDTGQIVAVKQVALTKDETLKGRVAEHVRALEAEVAVLLQLNHRNIVRYLGTERTEDTLNIFLEYVPGGSIASMIEKFGPLKTSVIRMYAQQILKGLEYLHQKKIMHRDIKGANILVDGRGTVKLADFGASKKIENLATIGSGSKSIRGTPYWMAPEVIKQTGHGRPADIWSLACVVIEMATGKPPWSNCHTQVAAMFHIASTKEPPPLPEHLPPEAKDFLLLCFNRVPKERPNATKLLRHPWMTGTSTHASPMKPLPPPEPAAPEPAHRSEGAEKEQQRHPLVPVLQLPQSHAASDQAVLEGAGSTSGPHRLPPLGPATKGNTTHPPQHTHHPQHDPHPPPPPPQPLYSGPTHHARTPNPPPPPKNTTPPAVAHSHFVPPPPTHNPTHTQQQPPQQRAKAPQPPQQPHPQPPPQQQPQRPTHHTQPSGPPHTPTKTHLGAATTTHPTPATPQPLPTPPQPTRSGAARDLGLAHAPTPTPAASGTGSSRTQPSHSILSSGTPTPAHTAAAGTAGTPHMQHMQQQPQPVHAQQPPPAHGRQPSGGGVLGAHRAGLACAPPPASALVSLAQQRTAAPMPTAGGAAAPLRGAQMRNSPVPRPSPHMFPQPRPQQQQQQPASSDYGVSEEASKGAARGGDQANARPKPQPFQHHAPPTTEKDTFVPDTYRAAASAANLHAPAHAQYMGPGHAQARPAPKVQDRDAGPVRDSKIQNWRDGLIKEMASKRQAGFRPPPGAAAPKQ